MRMRPTTLVPALFALVILSALPAAPLMAAEAGADAPPAPVAEKPAPAPAAPGDLTEAQAEMLVAAGKKAMAESNDNPSRSVDAAVAFSKALKYYQKTDNIDTVCDLEANIFWCKKRMNIDDVKKFVATKNGDKGVTDALATVDAVATKEVPKEKANDYFARAEKFARENPDKHDQIAVRYFEVAERFVGTEVGIKAQKMSLAAQQQQMKAIKAEQDAQRETLFTKPATQAKGASAVPAPDAQKSAVASIKKLYKDDYAKKKPNQKRNLVNKLLSQVETTKDDPTTQYGLLSEAIDLAMDTSDFYQAIIACDLMAANFSGIDATAQKKAALSRGRTNPTVQSILKLLDNPEDADANLVVGKYFCTEAQKWDLGLPLLAHAKDAEYKPIADMEMLKPSGTSQQIELADKWYDLGKKGRSPAKEAMLARAFTWYKAAQPALTGITKDRVKQRVEEIDGLLPMTNLDYENLTPKQWDRLKGGVVEVSAGRDRNDVNVRITKGQRLRIVPHPTDTWTSDYWSEPITVTWRGEVQTTTFNGRTILLGSTSRQFPIASLVVQVETGKWMKPGIIEGEGRIFMGPYCGSYSAGGKGVLRVKIMAVEDD
jgi:hypothetical protein